MSKWAVSAAGRRCSVCATSSAGSNRPGVLRQPRRALRLCVVGCSNRYRVKTTIDLAISRRGAFSELYNKEGDEFPLECRNADYERRIQAAYPIHPEIFDRLYEDWSTLVNFQRTRGVLRLMAAVIHSLWEKGDRNPLILPSTIPIDDARVQTELTRYLSDNWTPIIAGDVDGPNSLPLKIDNEVANLGKLSATRRAARTIYLGSAPTSTTGQRGIEDRRVKLGCVMPGESAQVFGDAIRRLAAQATYLYQDGPRYWYETQPTVTKLADDRAQQLERDPDAVHAELERRLEIDLGLKPREEKRRGDFYGVHLMPRSGGDVADQLETRLVVLDREQPFSRGEGNPAELAAHTILQSRGAGPRLYRNTLAFVAPDKVRLPDLDEAIRSYLAWESILSDRDELNLDPHLVRQAENQRDSANSAVDARLPETYCWVMVPSQANPSAEVRWQASRLSGSDHLAVRGEPKAEQRRGSGWKTGRDHRAQRPRQHPALAEQRSCARAYASRGLRAAALSAASCWAGDSGRGAAHGRGDVDLGP